MPFLHQLSEKLIAKLRDFRDQNDFIALYKAYNWRNDIYVEGFPDILNLETTLKESNQHLGISLQDVKKVADWGKLRNPGRIKGKDIVLPPMTLPRDKAGLTECRLLSHLKPLQILERNIESGIGPTYLSKVLRFGFPQDYGAIDTRCVRVFGQGDQANQKHDWLTLRARNDGYGWYISKTQSAWPDSYGLWLNILQYFLHELPKDCPHPQTFVASGLRSKSEWACADVEMALFAYASKFA